MSEKETPIGMIPSDWDYSPIGPSIDLLTGPAFDSSRFVDDTSCIRLVRGINVTKGHLRWEPQITLRWPNVTPDLERYHLKAGDIVIGMDGSLVGRNFATITKDDTPSLLVQRVARLRTDHSLCSSFLYYFIASDFWISHVDVVKTHSGIPHISNGDIRNFQITFPPLPQQKKIARVLTTVDNLIEKTEALIEKYKAIKQGMMHDLFTRGVDQNGKLRPPYEEAPHLYKESPLGWIPKEWECEKCVSLCREIVVGIVIQPTQYYTSWGIPVLRSANVREEGVIGDDLVYMSETSSRLLSKSMVRRGDIVTVRTGYPGTSSVITDEFDGANCVDIIISRPASGIRSEFLAFWINSDFGKTQVLRTQGGLAQQHFNVGELKNLLVAVPPMPEQHRTEEILLNLRQREAMEREALDKARQYKSGLMQDLLAGKVRVKVDEVEEELTNA